MPAPSRLPRVVFLCSGDHFHAPCVLRQARQAVGEALLVMTPKLGTARRGFFAAGWDLFWQSGLRYGLGMGRLRRRYLALARRERSRGRALADREFLTMPEMPALLDCSALAARSVNSDETRAAVAAFVPDAIVALFFNQIVGARLRALAGECWNLHPSVLPDFRGVSPALRALVEGADESGVSVHRMTERIDEGEILWRASAPISPDDSFFSLYRRLALLGGAGLASLLTALGRGALNAPLADDAAGSHYGPITRRDMRRLARQGRRLAGDLTEDARRAAALLPNSPTDRAS